MSYKGRTVFQSDWAKYGGYGLAFAGALSKEGYLPGLSGTIGTAGRVLDIGKILTADDRGKEISGMAGGVMGSLAGQRLLMPIIVGYGSQYQIAPILLSGGAAAVVVGTGYAGDLLAKYIYEEENKSDYIYYLKGLNQSNYNEDEFKERMEQNFDIIE